MSGEIRISLTTFVVQEVIAPPAHAGIYEHWCMHESCKRWGSFSYDRRFGPVWFCDERKADGETGR